MRSLAAAVLACLTDLLRGRDTAEILSWIQGRPAALPFWMACHWLDISPQETRLKLQAMAATPAAYREPLNSAKLAKAFLLLVPQSRRRELVLLAVAELFVPVFGDADRRRLFNAPRMSKAGGEAKVQQTVPITAVNRHAGDPADDLIGAGKDLVDLSETGEPAPGPGHSLAEGGIREFHSVVSRLKKGVQAGGPEHVSYVDSSGLERLIAAHTSRAKS